MLWAINPGQAHARGLYVNVSRSLVENAQSHADAPAMSAGMAVLESRTPNGVAMTTSKLLFQVGVGSASLV